MLRVPNPQTGAGKSYSFVGYGTNKGILPIVSTDIFQKVRAQPASSAELVAPPRLPAPPPVLPDGARPLFTTPEAWDKHAPRPTIAKSCLYYRSSLPPDSLP